MTAVAEPLAGAAGRARMQRMASPFVKWAGGKAKLAREVVERAPAHFGRYHEPFLGGGAVFFAFATDRPSLTAALSDTNEELINAYTVVRDGVDDLIAALRPLEETYLALDDLHRAQLYYQQREAAPSGPVARAARLIFMNKTCYNGLYRVNRKGQFNVPHGRYARPRILDEPVLRAASEALAGAALEACGFDEGCARAAAGDFVYLDPPYQPLSATAQFTNYTSADFGPADQVRLRDTFDDLTRRGVFAILSNSDHPFIRELYQDRGYALEKVLVGRAINSNPERRAPITELLISNAALVKGGQPMSGSPK